MLGLLLASALAGAQESGTALRSLWVSDLTGARAPLDSLLGGKPSLILFWNTPCQSCLDKLRSVEAFARDHANQGLGLLMINVDPPRNKNLIAPFVHRFGFVGIQYLDPDRQVFRRLGGRQTPYLLFVAGGGEILHRSVTLAARDLDRIAALLEALAPVATPHG